MKKALYIVSIAVLFLTGHAGAKTEMGNDLALYLDEAMGNKALTKELVEGSRGINYYFRYMQIMTREAGRENGRPYIKLTLMEPASYYIAKCKVIKPHSLLLLMTEPESREGDTLALTAKVESVDTDKSILYLNPVIVKAKDLAAPKRGKEMIYETHSDATVYQFTAVGGKPVNITQADRDLIPWLDIENPKKAGKVKDAIQKSYTKEGWADYLLGELERRKTGKDSKRGDAARRAGLIVGLTNAPVLTDAE